MITFEQAKKIALERIGPDCALIESSIIEKPYGWYFNFQSKKFIATQDHRYALVGSGGLIVERRDGRVFMFPSAYSREENLRKYEAGFRYGSYDLVIVEVSDHERTTDLLLKLRMTYVVPEEAHGTTWRIPTQFTRSMISRRLRSLPCTFRNQEFYFVTDVFEEIDEAQCCRYEILEGRNDYGLRTVGELLSNLPEGDG